MIVTSCVVYTVDVTRLSPVDTVVVLVLSLAGSIVEVYSSLAGTEEGTWLVLSTVAKDV